MACFRPAALLRLTLLLLLASCGGGGDSPAAAANAGNSLVAGAVAPANLAAPTDAADTADATDTRGINASNLAVVVIEGDATSIATGEAYVQAHGVPRSHLLRMQLPTGSDLVSQADFERAKRTLDAQMPAAIQGTVLAFSQPSRVVGDCTMSITSAMALGYDSAYCGGCRATRASPYFNSTSRQPHSELGLRPSMMLWAADLTSARALIARGVAAKGSQPSGAAWFIRSGDAARSVRYPQMQEAMQTWAQHPTLSVHYLDRQGLPDDAWIEGQHDLLFYFTGRTSVPALHTLGFLPGAVADHLTSYAGVLPAANGQMPATRWLEAGATGSYGTVEEPCNHLEKFPHPGVLMAHYLAGESLLEAYWKSVHWPGQGLFLGDPLASPWQR